MISSIVRKIILAKRRNEFRAGTIRSKFIAKDIRRDVKVIDVSRIDEGYITAQVRTTNVLYHYKGLIDEPAFGSPEILHVGRAWYWGGKSWGGAEPKRERIPLISAESFRDIILKSFPDAACQFDVVNHSYASWQMGVSVGGRTVEFVWGPLSGFGAIDPNTKDDSPFVYCDLFLYSVEDAIQWAIGQLTPIRAEP